MQRNSLIVRRSSGLDGRALSLTLTPRGMELTERIVPHALHYEDVAMDGLSERDVVNAERTAETVYDNLENADATDERRGRPQDAAARKTKRPASAAKRASKLQLEQLHGSWCGRSSGGRLR